MGCCGSAFAFEVRMMRKYNVTGMSCAACSARVEKAVSAVDGVDSCAVNLLTGMMSVEGSASNDKIIGAVVAAGYGAKSADPVSVGEKKSGNTGLLPPSETPALVRRMIFSIGFLALLMYISMGHVMWGAPLPSVLSNNPVAVALLELLLALAVMIINQKFFVSGFRGIIHRAPNMDTLVALGSGASFVYSVCLTFVMTDAQARGDAATATHLLHELYFESAAMILALITVGKLLESVSKGRTTKSLRALMDLSPKTATLVCDGEEIEVAIDRVKKGDVFAVRPGESIPVDGVIIKGESAVDESALTGESVPVDKAEGDSVSAGTINRSGYILCEAQRVGEDTTLSQIIKIVSDAGATKAPIARMADKVSGIFVPVVLAIALVTAIVWLFVDKNIGFALARAISVLVISCPCALGLATPVAIMVASGVGARRGILFKSARSLEITGRANTVVLDKTGTVTKGEMTVTDVIAASGTDTSRLISIASAVEKMSEHPLGVAIVKYAESIDVKIPEITGFRAVSGKGVEGYCDGVMICGGNLAFIEQKCQVPDTMKKQIESLAESGKTPMLFSQGSDFSGIIAVADAIKEDSAEAIGELKNMGMRVIMLTGDNSRTARAIGALAGVDEVISDVLPDKKAAEISRLRESGNVIMVGDGINDAPALAVADTGIAIGAGTDIAIEAADVVLVKSRLSDLPAAIKLSRATLRNIRQNLFWAFCYNSLGIPLAAGVFIPLLGWELDPMFGAAAMSLSSFCVVMNALRLNLTNVYKPTARKRRAEGHTHINDEKPKEEKVMTKTVNIDGMMCPHCSGRVKKVLEALDEVASAEVSHESGTAILTLNAPLSDEKIKTTVEDQGYTVTGIN